MTDRDVDRAAHAAEVREFIRTWGPPVGGPVDRDRAALFAAQLHCLMVGAVRLSTDHLVRQMGDLMSSAAHLGVPYATGSFDTPKNPPKETDG